MCIMAVHQCSIVLEVVHGVRDHIYPKDPTIYTGKMSGSRVGAVVQPHPLAEHIAGAGAVAEDLF